MARPRGREEQLRLLSRGLALALGAIAGTQVYARGGGSAAAWAVGGAIFVAALLLLGRLQPRKRPGLSEPPGPPAPRSRRAPRRSRRVLTDSMSRRP